MALINCPECSGSISSVAERCVHCGCKITVCPDCGEPHAGEKEFCSNCGFNFKKAGEVKNGKSFKGLLDYWKSSNPVDKVISRIIPIVFAVIGAAFIAFLIMAVTNVLRLGYNEDSSKIFKIGVSVTVAILFSVVFFVMLIATNLLHSAFITVRCGAWIRDNEIDVKRFTDHLRELPRSKRTFKNNREIRSAYTAEYPREFSKTVIISSVCGLFYIVCFIIACVFLNEGIDHFIVQKAFPKEGEEVKTLLDSIDWILLLIPLGIMSLSLATDIVFRVLLRKKVKAWLGYPTVIVQPDVNPEPEKKPESEVKPEAEASVETEAKSEPEENSKPEVKPEAEASPETEVKPEPEENLKPEVKLEAEASTETEVKSEPEENLKPEEKPEAEASTETEVKPEPEENLKPEEKPETEVNTESAESTEND